MTFIYVILLASKGDQFPGGVCVGGVERKLQPLFHHLPRNRQRHALEC